MDIKYEKRKCSAVRADGQRCQAWAIHDSEPALCSAHAGRNIGAGAPVGNQNALKHGYFTAAIKPKSLDDIDWMLDRSLLGELVLGRFMLGQLAGYLVSADLQTEEKLAVVPLINATIRTVVTVAGQIEDAPIDWDAVLDEVGKDWAIEI